MKINIITLIIGFAISFTAAAQNIKSLVLHYDEIEQGVGSQSTRYIVNKDFLRIDDGNNQSDYILFDVKQKTIYSINHEDQTILKIENNLWHSPKFDFRFETQQILMQDSPKILNKAVYSYLVKADDIVCTQVSLVKGMYPAGMQVLYQYQQVLSGQQVATLKNTPKEMHTPCFLVDQIYHTGDYYKVGLPVHISYSRGYEKFLKSFEESQFDFNLFKKPEGYSEYKAAL